jgi:hypothetical protein
LTLFIAFMALSLYNTGCMMALQLQHYAIYPAVGRDAFAEYIRANNRSATIPTIVPAMLLLLTSILLVIYRPFFVHPWEAAAGLTLNLLTLFSTFKWQRRLQGEMAVDGYDERKVQLLIRSNWLRTMAYLLLAILSISILKRLVSG